MSEIKVQNLKFSYGEKVVLNDISFSLKDGKSLSIIGTSGSGKTTLLKILNGDLPYVGEVSINGYDICDANFDYLSKEISVVFKNTNFLHTKVIDEIFSFSKKNEKIIEELDTFFSINRIIDKDIRDLSLNDKTLVKILSYVVNNSRYVVLDDLLIDLNKRTKILLLNYLNYKNIILINVTSNIEDVIYTDYIVCLYDGKIAIEGDMLEVLKNEKILKRLGFSLPFMVDLSIQLELYGLIDKIYLNKEAMVKNLWK